MSLSCFDKATPNVWSFCFEPGGSGSNCQGEVSVKHMGGGGGDLIGYRFGSFRFRVYGCLKNVFVKGQYKRKNKRKT